MTEIQERFKKGAMRPANKEYTKIQNRVKYMRRKGQDKTNETEYRTLLNQLIKVPSLEYDEKYNRIHYIRYADDFVIGVEGSLELTRQILEEVKGKLKELGLTLNESKTKITKFTTEPIEFLGYKIMGPYIEGIEKPIEVYREPNSGRLTTRRKKIRVRVYMDYDKVIKRMLTRGLIRKRVAPMSNNELIVRGTFQGNLTQLDHADILRYYNSVMRGVYNYYNFVNNMKKVAHIMWLLEESCCMTLMRKFRMKYMTQAYRKFGKDLGCEIKDKKGNTKRIYFEKPKSYESKHIKDLAESKNPMVKLAEVWNGKFTRSNLFKKCVICGTEENIEMHHVRKIRDLKNPQTLGKDFLTRQMMAINRKQIPICKEHHDKYHSGTMNEQELREFRKAASRKSKLQITKVETETTKTTAVNNVPKMTGAELQKAADERFRNYLNSSISEFDLIPKPTKVTD